MANGRYWYLVPLAHKDDFLPNEIYPRLFPFTSGFKFPCQYIGSMTPRVWISEKMSHTTFVYDEIIRIILHVDKYMLPCPIQCKWYTPFTFFPPPRNSIFPLCHGLFCKWMHNLLCYISETCRYKSDWSKMVRTIWFCFFEICTYKCAQVKSSG